MDDTLFARAGMAALLPGMKFMLEQMQREIRTFEALLDSGVPPRRGPGRPRKTATDNPIAKQGGSAGYWAKMTPEQRKAEMKRRMELNRKKHGSPTQRIPTHNKDGWPSIAQAAKDTMFSVTTWRTLVASKEVRVKQETPSTVGRPMYFLHPEDVKKAVANRS